MANLCPEDATLLPELWEAWEGRETWEAPMSPLRFPALGPAMGGPSQPGWGVLGKAGQAPGSG